MSDGPTEGSGARALRCLGGQEPPPRLEADLARLLALPAPAQEDLWTVLAPTLPDPIPPATEKLIEAFSGKYGVSGADLAIALKAARYLLRRASEVDLSAAELAADLAILGGEARRDLERLLLRGYEVAKTLVREEIISRAVARHGPVLLGADWRIDVIARSPEAPVLRAPIAMLTLRYLDEGRERWLTLQATPDAVRRLSEVCRELLV